MGLEIKIKDNKDEIERAIGSAIYKSLEEIGVKAEKYAKALCPVGTSESTGKKGYRGGGTKERKRRGPWQTKGRRRTTKKSRE